MNNLLYMCILIGRMSSFFLVITKSNLLCLTLVPSQPLSFNISTSFDEKFFTTRRILSSIALLSMLGILNSIIYLRSFIYYNLCIHFNLQSLLWLLTSLIWQQMTKETLNHIIYTDPLYN